MGERTRQHSGNHDRGGEVDDSLDAVPEGRLRQLLADPRTRPGAMKRIAARRQRLAAEKKKQPEQVADGTTTQDAETTEHTHKTTFEKKKYEQVTDGTLTHERTKAVTTQEGEGHDVHERTYKGSLSKADGLTLGVSGSDEIATGDDISTKTQHSGGISADTHGAHLKGGLETEAQVGEDKYKDGAEASVGFKHGKFDADFKATQKTEDAKGATEHSQTLAFEDDKFKMGAGRKQETKHDVTQVDADGKPQTVSKNSSSGMDGSVAIGKDGAAVEAGRQKTNVNGTQSKTTVGAEVNWEEGSASGSVGHKISDKDGNSASGKIKAGVEVHASDPVQVGDRWVVTYTRTKSLGGTAAGSSHGMGANAGVTGSDFENGSRSFKSEKEAKEFKEHASERIKDAPDPRSVAGALALAVGESRGTGSALEGTLGGSASMEGATIGVSGHEKSSDEIDVKRLPGMLFDVTYLAGSEKGGDLNAGGMGATANSGESSNQHHAVTVRFDLNTDEGKRAFEQYCKDHRVPAKGGKVVSTEEGKGHEAHDGLSLAGLVSSQFTGRTSENTRIDEDGKHEDYQGEQTQDSKPGWVGSHVFGEDKLHSSTEISARQENDKDAGYTVTGKISGENGTYNRGKMQHLLGRDENFDESKTHASGEWTMTADIDKKTLDGMERYSERWKGVKSNDDRMRVLGQWVADDGMDAVNSIKGWNGNQALDWDLELKGDKNFPGRAGREQLEARMKRYGEMLSATGGGAASSVTGEVQGEIDALKTRREEVAKEKKYTDLPSELRQQQLKMIDRQIAGFEAVRHRAALEAVKSRPGEDIGHVINREHDPQGYANVSPEQKPLALLRDQIAEKDAAIVAYQQQSAEAEPAILRAVQYTDWSKRDAGKLAGVAGKVGAQAKALDHAQRAAYLKIDELRMSFLRSLGDPAHAISIGQALVGQLQAQLDLAANAQAKYFEAARAQVVITKDAGLAQHDKFWQDVRDTMETEDFDLDDDGQTGMGSDSDDDRDSAPQPRVSMKLP